MQGYKQASIHQACVLQACTTFQDNVFLHATLIAS